MLEYHVAWLSAHRHRSAKWLLRRLAEGFDIHHLDGDHENNDPDNLVLIEHSDHMRLHGGRMVGRLDRAGKVLGVSERVRKRKEPSKAYLAAKARVDALRARINGLEAE
jgi:hypothetical protein